MANIGINRIKAWLPHYPYIEHAALGKSELRPKIKALVGKQVIVTYTPRGSEVREQVTGELKAAVVCKSIFTRGNDRVTLIRLTIRRDKNEKYLLLDGEDRNLSKFPEACGLIHSIKSVPVTQQAV